ncbi:MAG: hypothetical protein IJ524_04265 [Bacteroidales bacterium]|nr:hypothetical protein [Bacteroidales bacterium]
MIIRNSPKALKGRQSIAVGVSPRNRTDKLFFEPTEWATLYADRCAAHSVGSWDDDNVLSVGSRPRLTYIAHPVGSSA